MLLTTARSHATADPSNRCRYSCYRLRRRLRRSTRNIAHASARCGGCSRRRLCFRVLRHVGTTARLLTAAAPVRPVGFSFCGLARGLAWFWLLASRPHCLTWFHADEKEI